MRHSGSKKWRHPRSAGPVRRVAAPSPTRNKETTSRKKVIILLAIGIAVSVRDSAFPVVLRSAVSQPRTSQQRFPLLFFAALTILIFLLFVALTFVLARNLLKLFAERRLGVLGSKFRTRLVVGGLLLSFLPVIMMFWFAYGLMNRSIGQVVFASGRRSAGGHGGGGLAGIEVRGAERARRGRVHCGGAGDATGLRRS